MNPNIDPTPTSPVWFRCPESLVDSCSICNMCILPGQLVTDSDGEFIHELCWAYRIEDMHEENEDLL